MNTPKYFPISEPVNQLVNQPSNTMTYVIITCIVIVVIAIIVKFIHMYDLLSYFNRKVELPNNTNTEIKPKELIEPTIINLDDKLKETTNVMMPTDTMTMTNTTVKTNIDVNTNNELTVSMTPSEEAKPSTKQQYNKGDEITLPSSISSPLGYIGRDQVCFRGKLGDIGYMKQRPGCMACMVDNRPEKERKTYDGTNTNIVASCAYSNEDVPNDPTVWTKQKCIIQCNKIPDLK